MRGLLAAVLVCLCICAHAAAPAPSAPLEGAGLRSIAGWLRAHGTQGFLAGEVADALGIAREPGVELLAARQRGFRDAEVLRIAQALDGEYLLFMVQSPGEVYFYLCTVNGGLRKAMVASRALVTPLEATEAESNFRREVLYWEDKAAR
jgi:hypothetical protein